MSKQLYWFIAVKNIENPEARYLGHIAIGKRERSVKFYFEQTHNMNGFEYKRVVEIPEKVYNRLNHIYKLRSERKYEEMKKSGKVAEAKSALRGLLGITASLDGPYSYQPSSKMEKEVVGELAKFAFSKDDGE